MKLRDALSGVTMSIAALVFAVAAVRGSIRVHRGARIAQPRLLIASQLAMTMACGTLAASFFLAGARRLSLVLLIPAVMAFILGFSLERTRAHRMKAKLFRG